MATTSNGKWSRAVAGFFSYIPWSDSESTAFRFEPLSGWITSLHITSFVEGRSDRGAIVYMLPKQCPIPAADSS
jgi:hypothetical protein